MAARRRVVTNLEKMNELVEANASKKEIMKWAEMNRLWLSDLPYVTADLRPMGISIDNFMSGEKHLRDESEIWSDFLDSEYLGGSGDEEK